MEQTRPLGGYIRALANALSQDMRQNSEELGLTASQGMFLHHLWHRQQILRVDSYARDLEQFFDIKHPTVSGILQRMEAAGFVVFEASDTDRRCKRIRLTQKALDAHDKTAQHIRCSESRLVQGMTPEEADEFRRLLALAAYNLDVCHRPRFSQKEESEL